MGRPLRNVKNKKVSKQTDLKSFTNKGKQIKPVINNENKLNNCKERIVLKDQTNLPHSEASNLVTSPDPVKSNKYGLRKTPVLDYKKLSIGASKDEKDDQTCSNDKLIKSKVSTKIKNVNFENSPPVRSILKPLNNKISPVLKISKPIYKMQNCTPLKRKSEPLEKKLEIYEFEVDENECIPKQKKKRIRKKVQKDDLAKLNYRKCVEKKPLRDNKKPLPKKETERKIISTKNAAMPQSEYKKCIRSDDKGILLSNEAKLHHSFEVPVLFHNHQDASPKKPPSNNSEKRNFTTMSDEADETKLDRSVEVPVLFHNHQDASPTKKPSSNNSEKRNFTTMSDEVDETKLDRSVEVPVLFHNHQDASPPKKLPSNNTEKANFTTMSAEANRTYEDCVFEQYFSSNSKKTVNNSLNDKSRSYNRSYDNHISASTPVKYNYNDSYNDSSVYNYFGFDEPELFEDSLVSPIKISELSGLSNSSGKALVQKVEQQSSNIKKKEEIPVQRVIKMLKYGSDEAEDTEETRSRSSSNSVSPIFNDPEDEITKKVVKPAARRSYERPLYLRKKVKNYEEENSGAESDEETIKTLIPKKKQGLTKKEQDEMQKWIQEFNSQCQEVESFNLVVE